MAEPSKRRMDVFTTVEDTKGNVYFKNIGVAFENRDRSINVILDALPVNGKLHIRDARKKGTHDECGHVEKGVLSQGGQQNSQEVCGSTQPPKVDGVNQK